MEPFWSRFIAFIKESLTQKFKAFLPGVFMGFISAQHILWIGVPATLVEYAGKYIGTVFMAFGSGLATSYAAYLIDQYKKKKNGTRTRKKGKADRAA